MNQKHIKPQIYSQNEFNFPKYAVFPYQSKKVFAQIININELRAAVWWDRG